MFKFPISKTKIIPPRRRPELLARRRLLEMFYDMLERKLTLVSAPAGYGKTSLLIDAALECEFKCCWLSLDELDRDPQRFLAYLVASIGERFPGVGAQTAALMTGAATLEEEMERLAVTLVNETLEGIKEHFVLILDDFHILDGVQPIYDFLNRFIQLADDNCHMVVSSRTLTILSDLPLMVAREQVSGLSFSDLAFRKNEIQELILQNNNVHISDDDAQKLIDESEGWITGLQFSGSLFTRAGSANPVVNTGAGLFDFLGQQVVDRQKPELRDVLLRTSLMDEFDADLCEAVLSPLYPEKQDWHAFMQAILKNNLFAIPVGSDGRSLRYHHLFREYLSQRMERERKGEIAPIMRRLARAYENAGEWEKAHYFIQKLGDPESHARLIELASFNNLQNTGRMVETWLRGLRPHSLHNRPRILSVSGTIRLIKGDYRGGIADLDRAIAAFRETGEETQLALALIRRSSGYRYLGQYQTSLDDVDEAIRLIAEADDRQSLRAEALHIRGSCMYRLGQTRQALREYEQSLEILTRLDQAGEIPRLLADIATAHQSLGDYPEAESAYYQALKYWKAEANLWEQAGLLNNMGSMFHREGEYEKAASAYEEGLLCARRSRHTRMETFLSIGLGDLYTELGDAEIAAQNYLQAERLLEERRDAFLLFSLHLGRANLALFQNHLAQAEKEQTTLAQIVAASKSSSENGLFDLFQGKVLLFKGDAAAAAVRLESAQESFDRQGLLSEAVTARIWLAAAHTALRRPEEAAVKIGEALRDAGSASHAVVSGIAQAGRWLESLPGRREKTLRDLFARAERLAVRIPDIRRELRRQARVVDVPAAHFSINGFGRAGVQIGGRELSPSDWQTQSVRDLFFYFLSQTKPLTREQIWEEFWDSLEEPAKVRLRFKNEMYRLRRAVGNEAILFENAAYAFNRKLDYEYDVEAFESHLARAKSAQSIAEQIAAYRKAVDLVKGPYLDDIYLDWVILDRERLDQHYLSALLALAGLYQKQAQMDEALAMCQRAVEYKPAHEEAYRLMMELHHRRGDRPAVSRAYQTCVETLRKTLSMPPSKETEDLYRRLNT